MSSRSRSIPRGLTPAEETIARAYTKRGDEVLRNGWPDFLVVRDARAFAVEVKSGRDRLTAAQLRMHGVLRDVGLEVLVVRPDRGGVHLPVSGTELRDAIAELERVRAEIHELQSQRQQLEGVLETLADEITCMALDRGRDLADVADEFDLEVVS